MTKYKRFYNVLLDYLTVVRIINLVFIYFLSLLFLFSIYFIFGFYFFNLDLDKRYNVTLCIIVIQVTNHDINMISVTPLYNIEKIIESFKTDNIV